ncbi:hypothetical protein PM082_011052 [Marasmius tenuissimus]|nr:hypothetical protein PM082_011052 [Marasmius tenuissimus]
MFHENGVLVETVFLAQNDASGRWISLTQRTGGRNTRTCLSVRQTPLIRFPTIEERFGLIEIAVGAIIEEMTTGRSSALLFQTRFCLFGRCDGEDSRPYRAMKGLDWYGFVGGDREGDEGRQVTSRSRVVFLLTTTTISTTSSTAPPSLPTNQTEMESQLTQSFNLTAVLSASLSPILESLISRIVLACLQFPFIMTKPHSR